MSNYKIFLSGPSDVNEFIEVARQTIHEINMLTGPMGLHFDPFDWLENVTPGIADEPQAVINEQAIGYSAIVAILGSKVGSPTKHYESGTIEEIEKAVDNADSLPFGSKSVMVFFKDTLIDIKSADLDQARKIQHLRSSLGPKGVLFKDFTDERKFRENLLRCFGIIIANHLSRSVDYNPKLSQDATAATLSSVEANSDEDALGESDDELGLLDLNDIQTALMGDSSAGLQRINSEMSALSDYMSEKTPEIEKANGLGDQSAIRKIFSDISKRMIGLSDIIDEESPKIENNYKNATQHLRALIDLWSSDFSAPSSEDQLDELKLNLIKLLSSVTDSKNAVISYMNSTRSLPRLTKEINTAKRRLVASNDKYFLMLEEVAAETESMLKFINAKRA